MYIYDLIRHICSKSKISEIFLTQNKKEKKKEMSLFNTHNHRLSNISESSLYFFQDIYIIYIPTE